MYYMVWHWHKKLQSMLVKKVTQQSMLVLKVTQKSVFMYSNNTATTPFYYYSLDGNKCF